MGRSGRTQPLRPRRLWLFQRSPSVRSPRGRPRTKPSFFARAAASRDPVGSLAPLSLGSARIRSVPRRRNRRPRSSPRRVFNPFRVPCRTWLFGRRDASLTGLQRLVHAFFVPVCKYRTPRRRGLSVRSFHFRHESRLDSMQRKGMMHRVRPTYWNHNTIPDCMENLTRWHYVCY